MQSVRVCVRVCATQCVRVLIYDAMCTSVHMQVNVCVCAGVHTDVYRQCIFYAPLYAFIHQLV